MLVTAEHETAPKPAYSREEIEAIIAKTPFAAWAGAKLVSYKYGEVEINLSMRRELTQHHGFGHGAIVGLLADSACAWAAASIVGDVVTAEYKLNFLAPAVGHTLLAYGSVLGPAGRQTVCRADIYCQTQSRKILVATALATIAQVGRA
ncbi:PaaI family thioesterase [Thalassospira marina]|uniref:Thioesterase n=1 Tax=Thalassospira marina TaxID=2048283 RepID=A0ABM6QGM4_9PROT|nr:PaaI family thioesterase [Thalassospira marina]AUG55744.1 thioesterase [Thalassospira marina]